MSDLNKNYFDGMSSIVGSAILIAMGGLLLVSIILVLATRRKMLPICFMVLVLLVAGAMAVMSFVSKVYDMTTAKLPANWQALLQGRIYIYLGLMVLFVLLLLTIIFVKKRDKEELEQKQPVQYDRQGNLLLPQSHGYLGEGDGSAFLGEGQGDFFDEQQGHYDEFGRWIAPQYGSSFSNAPSRNGQPQTWAIPETFNDSMYDDGDLLDGMGLELSRAEEELQKVKEIQAQLEIKKKEVAKEEADVKAKMAEKAKQDALNMQLEQAKIEAEIAQAEAELVKAEALKAAQEKQKQDQEKLVAEIARLESENARIVEEKAREVELAKAEANRRPSILDRVAARPTLGERAARTQTTSNADTGTMSLKDRVEAMRKEREAKVAEKPVSTRATSTTTAKTSLAERTSTKTQAPSSVGGATSLKDRVEAMRKERDGSANTATATKSTASTTAQPKKKLKFERDENGKMVLVKDAD